MKLTDSMKKVLRKVRREKTEKIRIIILFEGWKDKSPYKDHDDFAEFRMWTNYWTSRLCLEGNYYTNTYNMVNRDAWNMEGGNRTADGCYIPFDRLPKGQNVQWAMFDYYKKCLFVRTESGILLDFREDLNEANEKHEKAASQRQGKAYSDNNIL